MENIKIKKIHEEWCIKNGYKRTSKQQAIQETVPHNDIKEASVQALKRRVGPQAIKRGASRQA